MKNKISFLILIASFYFTKPAYCQLQSQGCDPECYIETPAPDFDCGVRDAYRYVSFGVGPVFMPNVGIGYRMRDGRFGWDTALSFSTLGFVHQINAHFVGHYYLSPQKNSAYLGLGLMGSGFFSNHKHVRVTLSPDFVIGKELRISDDSRHFIEMHVSTSTIRVNSTRLPLMYIKYGIAF